MKNKIAYFKAEWCLSCKSIEPLLKDIPHETINLSDGDKAEDRAMLENVNTLPTLIFYHKGEEIFRRTGAFGKSDLDKMIQDYGG